jgi:tetratricopeptide (TPR) repeat protein
MENEVKPLLQASDAPDLGPAPASFSLRPRGAVAAVSLLAVLVFVVFWPVLKAEFLNFDDPDFVTQNPHVLGGLSPGNIVWAFSSTYIYWQPLTWLSYMLDYHAYGLGAGGFHFTNLFLHALNSVLLFLILNRMTGNYWHSVFVAVLFAVHPLHVETVAWIAERKGVLSSLFWMLALGAYVRYAARPSPPRLAMVLLCYALGLTAKSMVITLPAVLLLLDFWPLQRLPICASERKAVESRIPMFPPQPWHRIVVEKLLFIPLAVGSAIITVSAQSHGGNVWSSQQYTPWLRVCHALVSYATYLRKTLLPFDLSVFYPHPITHPAWVVASSVVVLAAISIGAISQARRRYLLVGWLWFIVTLLPVIGLFQTGDQAMADRYTYLPLIGLFIILAWGGLDLVTLLRARPGFVVASPILVIAFWLPFTCGQVRYWKNTRALFEHALAVTPNNYVACAVLGEEWRRAGRLAEATTFLVRALEFRPNYFEGHTALADALRAGQKLDESVTHYDATLKLNPNYADALNGLGATLVLQGKPDEGLAYIERALRINPDLLPAHLNRALALQAVGRLAEAKAQFQEVLPYNTNAASALLGLGNAFLLQRKYADAFDCFAQLLQLQPDCVPALNRAAWLLATQGDPRIRNGREALRLAQRACDLTGNTNAHSLNTLAAAYAEIGQFDQAVATAQRALASAHAQSQPEVAGIIQKLLEMYQRKTPYRE